MVVLASAEKKYKTKILNIVFIIFFICIAREPEFTSSVNSTTGAVADVGVDDATAIGSFSNGGVDEIGDNDVV